MKSDAAGGSQAGSIDMASVGGPIAWGSDLVAATIRALDIPYLAMVPGSSFRGLHDSLVNHLGNRDPDIVLCLHEEHAVTIADGYAKVTGNPMAVALHANVGLMHAAMAIFNAWCERSPMLLIGGNGPMDADRRRPWIDWVHTSRDPAALIRNFVKWDDHPASPAAAVESLLRANQITRTMPHGPVYVVLDQSLQEEAIDDRAGIPEVSRFSAPTAPAIAASQIDRIADSLRNAKFPLLLAGRGGRGQRQWDRRVALAEAIGGVVMTSVHNQAVFPNEHPLHVLPTCAERTSSRETEIIAKADVILSLDWMDLGGFLRAAGGSSQSQRPLDARIIHASMDAQLANGWSQDHQALAAIDIPVQASPDTLVEQLLDALPARSVSAGFPHLLSKFGHWCDEPWPGLGSDTGGGMSIDEMAATFSEFSARREDVTIARMPIGWPGRALRLRSPLSYMGKDSGAAVGTGPGHCVGTALALRDSGRLVIGVLGDGDYLMGINALWTATHLDLALMIVIANNQSYYNDELHQERVAIARDRPVENKWVGQRLDDPAIDLLGLARAQDFIGEGPVDNTRDFLAALQKAADIVAGGGRVVINANITPGYTRA